MTTTPDPVTDVWELLHTAACDYRDQAGTQRSEAGLIDALMPVVRAYAVGQLFDFAALIDRGPTFPLPPSIFSAMARERAADIAEEAS